jgi:hypothetical protein
MAVAIVIGILMSFAGGTVIDTMVDGFTAAGVYDVPAAWDSTGRVNTLINLYYFVMYLIPLIGIAIFFTTVLKRQKYDRYGNIYEDR